MQLNGTRHFQFNEMPTLERVETTQSNANNQATENGMIFHYFTFFLNELIKNAFQLLFLDKHLCTSPFKMKKILFLFKC